MTVAQAIALYFAAAASGAALMNAVWTYWVRSGVRDIRASMREERRRLEQLEADHRDLHSDLAARAAEYQAALVALVALHRGDRGQAISNWDDAFEHAEAVIARRGS